MIEINGINIGFTSGQLPISISAGATYTLTLPDKQRQSLNNIYLEVAAANDGIYVVSH